MCGLHQPKGMGLTCLSFSELLFELLLPLGFLFRKPLVVNCAVHELPASVYGEKTVLLMCFA